MVHTSEHMIAVQAAGPEVLDLRTLEPARRPGCRPTEYWSLHQVRDLIESEECAMGVGAATELPHGWEWRPSCD
jgi:hypothetical protein